MELKAVKNMIKLTLALATIVFIYSGLAEGFYESLGIYAGASWACVNLWFIAKLMKNLLDPESKNYMRVLGFVGIKFPVLYAIGYFLLASPYFFTYSLMIGFTLLMVSVFFQWIWDLF